MESFDEDLNDTDADLDSSFSSGRKNIHQSSIVARPGLTVRNELSRSKRPSKSHTARRSTFSFHNRANSTDRHSECRDVFNDQNLYNHSGKRSPHNRSSLKMAQFIINETDSYNYDSRRELKNALSQVNTGASATRRDMIYTHAERSSRSKNAKSRIRE